MPSRSSFQSAAATVGCRASEPQGHRALHLCHPGPPKLLQRSLTPQPLPRVRSLYAPLLSHQSPRTTGRSCAHICGRPIPTAVSLSCGEWASLRGKDKGAPETPNLPPVLAPFGGFWAPKAPLPPCQFEPVARQSTHTRSRGLDGKARGGSNPNSNLPNRATSSCPTLTCAAGRWPTTLAEKLCGTSQAAAAAISAPVRQNHRERNRYFVRVLLIELPVAAPVCTRALSPGVHRRTTDALACAFVLLGCPAPCEARRSCSARTSWSGNSRALVQHAAANTFSIRSGEGAPST